MNRAATTAVIAGALLGLGRPASAGLVHLDFENASNGEMITDQYEGLRFGLVGAGDGVGPTAHSLTKKKLIKKYGMAGAITLRPSSENRGTFKGPWYDIEIAFDAPTDFFTMLAMDADEPVRALAYLGEELVDSIGFRGGSNYQLRDLTLGEIGGAVFDRVVIDIREKGGGMHPGPELFDNLTYNLIDTLPGTETERTSRAIETPAPGALLVLGAGALPAMRRRRGVRAGRA
ncbi:MAG: hypothetical protein H6813_06105 [Phycisphaeraceae bacterium]|nr:hypothetical protein [Phycisphaeraceae bacterium]MCB9848043.1 hypothetical protein [Phycisphaeraceae bacterium]